MPTITLWDKKKIVILAALNLVGVLISAYAYGHMPISVIASMFALINGVSGLLQSPAVVVPSDPADPTKPAVMVAVPSIKPPAMPPEAGK